MRDLFASDSRDSNTPPDSENTENQDITDIQDSNRKLNARCRTVRADHMARRVTSEMSLEQALPWHFSPGDSFLVISNGDVDSLSYLRMAVRQQHVEYMVISTWRIGLTDVKEINSWIDRGFVDRVDFYVGELFMSRLAEQYIAMSEICRKCGGRIAVFRNHAKISAGFGDRFDFVFCGSANLNTNPRLENMFIAMDSGLARFTKEYFDGIRSFNNDFNDWKPYILKRDEII